MKRALLIGALVLVIGAPEASATTVQQVRSADFEPKPIAETPYQGWLNASSVPTPDIYLHVTERPCDQPNADPGLWGCVVWTDPDTGSAGIYIQDWVVYLSPLGHEAFIHEIGHLADRFFIDDAEAGRVLALLRPVKQAPTEWATRPTELLASGYATCAIPPPITRKIKRRGVPIWQGTWWIPFRRWRQACNAFRAASP